MELAMILRDLENSGVVLSIQLKSGIQISGCLERPDKFPADLPFQLKSKGAIGKGTLFLFQEEEVSAIILEDSSFFYELYKPENRARLSEPALTLMELRRWTQSQQQQIGFGGEFVFEGYAESTDVQKKRWQDLIDRLSDAVRLIAKDEMGQKAIGKILEIRMQHKTDSSPRFELKEQRLLFTFDIASALQTRSLTVEELQKQIEEKL